MLTEFSHVRADMHAHSMNHEMYICCQNILSAWSEKLLQLYTLCKTLAACVCTCLFTCILLYQTVLPFLLAHALTTFCERVRFGNTSTCTCHWPYMYTHDVVCLDWMSSYSARLIGHRADTLTVASGTVFNQILLWHLERERSNSRVKVRLCLTGHEVCTQSRKVEMCAYQQLLKIFIRLTIALIFGNVHKFLAVL